MAYERDEEYWYGIGWADLRSQLVKLCIRHADDLLEILADPAADDEYISNACKKWFDDCILAISAILRARPEAERWRHSMRLLIDSSSLVVDLARDRILRCGSSDDDRRRAALGACLRRYLEKQRIASFGDASHRRKVWEKLDRISRGLVPLEAEPGYRCGLAHHLDILEEIKRHYDHDHNLPRRLATISGHFLEFCNECREAIDPEAQPSALDILVLTEETHLSPDPMRCFRELAAQWPDAAESFAVVKKLQDLLPSNDRFLSVQAYIAQRSLSKRQIYKRVRQATDYLINCLRLQLERE